MTAPGPWLDDDEQRVWRQWLAVSARLPAALHRQLQEGTGLSLPDFDVLVRLTDTLPDADAPTVRDAGGAATADGTSAARLRVGDLAEALQWERSRLSHHLRRMEGRGLVAREECADDGRGAFVVLTPAGRAAIEAAAPDHVRLVRSLVFDALTPAQVTALGEVTAAVLARLDA
ncbi:MarR family transcriptional regulator [Nocardioides perillae]|uniref:DNA-binding MarR family transcriptional regulator n=1 Tax=Nocardioides perillae TaxID=1119534 RepID=A0A7Y9RY79_9ACTN|nr:DNA-binding MarR family transcriptional regulator [Nocardioides perillae]